MADRARRRQRRIGGGVREDGRRPRGWPREIPDVWSERTQSHGARRAPLRPQLRTARAQISLLPLLLGVLLALTLAVASATADALLHNCGFRADSCEEGDAHPSVRQTSGTLSSGHSRSTCTSLCPSFLRGPSAEAPQLCPTNPVRTSRWRACSAADGAAKTTRRLSRRQNPK